MATIKTFYIQKDPNSVLDYEIDWTEWLDADTIATSTWTFPAGLTKDSDTNTTTTTTVWASGGTVGLRYAAVNRIVTAAGRTEDAELVFNVTDRF